MANFDKNSKILLLVIILLIIYFISSDYKDNFDNLTPEQQITMGLETGISDFMTKPLPTEIISKPDVTQKIDMVNVAFPIFNNQLVTINNLLQSNSNNDSLQSTINQFISEFADMENTNVSDIPPQTQQIIIQYLNNIIPTINNNNIINKVMALPTYNKTITLNNINIVNTYINKYKSLLDQLDAFQKNINNTLNLIQKLPSNIQLQNIKNFTLICNKISSYLILFNYVYSVLMQIINLIIASVNTHTNTPANNAISINKPPMNVPAMTMPIITNPNLMNSVVENTSSDQNNNYIMIIIAIVIIIAFLLLNNKK